MKITTPRLGVEESTKGEESDEDIGNRRRNISHLLGSILHSQHYQRCSSPDEEGTVVTRIYHIENCLSFSLQWTSNCSSILRGWDT